MAAYEQIKIRILSTDRVFRQRQVPSQLSNRESLRDLIVALEAHQSKRYHLGLGREPIAKTTFATANQNRDYHIFEEFAFYTMDLARK